jgi:hypothetical protein
LSHLQLPHVFFGVMLLFVLYHLKYLIFTVYLLGRFIYTTYKREAYTLCSFVTVESYFALHFLCTVQIPPSSPLYNRIAVKQFSITMNSSPELCPCNNPNCARPMANDYICVGHRKPVGHSTHYWCPPCHALKFTKKTGAVLQSSKLKVQRKETTWNALKSTKKAGAREKRKLSQKVGGRKQPPRRCQRCRSQLFELQEVLPYVRSGRLYHL